MQKRLVSKRVRPTVWAYNRLKDLVRKDRERISENKEPHGGANAHDLIQLMENMEEEEELDRNEWPPEQGADSLPADSD